MSRHTRGFPGDEADCQCGGLRETGGLHRFEGNGDSEIMHWGGFTFSDSLAAISILLILSAAFFSAVLFIYRNTGSIGEQAEQEVRLSRIMQAAEEMAESISSPYWANVERFLIADEVSARFAGGYGILIEENALRFLFPQGDINLETAFDARLEPVVHNSRTIGVLILLSDSRDSGPPRYSIPIVPASYPILPPEPKSSPMSIQRPGSGPAPVASIGPAGGDTR